MTRTVQGERFFHINRSLHYSLHPRLSLGDQITVGAAENPFFRFFRTHALRYPVTQQDGTVVNVPALAFLRGVRDGYTTPNNLPRDAFEIAQHFLNLIRELLWETVRIAEFPEAPSRQRGIWLLANRQAVAQWEPRLQGQPGNLQVVEVLATGRALECDAALLLGESELLDETFRKAREYWSGTMATQGSLPEVLFEGELEVVRVLDPEDY